jgi:CRP/FNR family transcriptional regulator
MHSAMPVSTVCNRAATNPAPAGAFTATMAELLQACGVPATLQAAAAAIPLSLRSVRAGSALVHEGAPADSLFFVRTGTFKVSRTDEDGYEQVLAFAIRGEVLGFDALCMESHPAAVIALEDSTVFMIPRRQIETYSEAVPAFAIALQQAGSLTLSRSREMVDILAAVASEVRLARFLILLSRRMAGCGQSPRRFHLRMGRRDIASLLGVAQETISRGFGALSAMGLLHVEDRNVEILDMAELKAFSRSTRRATDEQALMRRKSLVTARRSGSLRPLHA